MLRRGPTYAATAFTLTKKTKPKLRLPCKPDRPLGSLSSVALNEFKRREGLTWPEAVEQYMRHPLEYVAYDKAGYKFRLPWERHSTFYHVNNAMAMKDLQAHCTVFTSAV